MQYRRIGTTDLDVSVIGLGTWQFGGEWGKNFSQKEVDAILNEANAQGINFIDTAECYGDHLSERFIGDYLKRNKREDWLIGTKFGHHFHQAFERTRHWDPDDVLKQLDQSLKSLKTDYIDLYQAHSCTDEEFNNDALWTMLDKQKQAGKIRNIGISLRTNDEPYQVESAREVGVDAIQIVYNRLDRAPESEVFPIAEKEQLGVLARVPLASGYLSGKYKPGAQFDPTDVRSRRDKEEQLSKLKEVEKIMQTEVPENTSMATWALAWCLQHPAVTTVIPGCKNPEQVISNAAAANLSSVSPNHPQYVSK